MKIINEIRLHGVLPDVFARQEQALGRSVESQVWHSDLTLERGTEVLIEAESGAGKSSLCSFLVGVRHDYQGNIFFDDADISLFSPSQWAQVRRSMIAYLPQDLKVFPELTALENVLLKNRLTDYYTEKEIAEMFDELDIVNKLQQPAGLLSIGQQQRVALIRTLCQPFSFILLDEPVSHLDNRSNAEAAKLVEREAQRRQAGVIVTSVGNPLVINNNISLAL